MRASTRSAAAKRSRAMRLCCWWRLRNAYCVLRKKRQTFTVRRSIGDVLLRITQYEVRSHDTMSLRVYNTLTRTKDLFDPVVPGKVGMYLCGPTVYKPPHIGHLVGPVIFDAVKRYLQFKGFEVTWV